MTGALVVRPADPLDIPEARRLVRELERLPEDVRVHLDVSALREVHPAALAYLAYALDGDDRIALRGLNRRHERLLGYLLGRATAPAQRIPPLPLAEPGGEGRGEGAPG